MKTLSCRETGAQCDFIARGRTDEEVLSKAAEHGKKAHGMKDTDLTPEKMKKFRGLIHEETQQRM